MTREASAAVLLGVVRDIGRGILQPALDLALDLLQILGLDRKSTRLNSSH